MKKAIKRVLGYGGAFMDVVYRVPEEFVASLRGAKGGAYNCAWEEQEAIIASIPADCVKSRKVRAGGGIGNALSHIGAFAGILKTMMCAVVGDDKEGCQYIASLVDRDVDVSRVKKVPGAHTGRCLSLVTPDGERTMYTYQGINAELGRHWPLKKSDFNGITSFYTEGYMLIDEPMMRRTLDIARSCEDMEIHFDVGSVGVIMEHQNFIKVFLPSRVDYLYANYDEACALTGASIPEAIVDIMAVSYFCPLVKLGKDGAICVDDVKNEVVRVPLYDEPLEDDVDTTGAGDVWAGSFIMAHLTFGKNVTECVRWANDGAYDFLDERSRLQNFTDDDYAEILKRLEASGKDSDEFDVYALRNIEDAILAEKKAKASEK
ncbi:MAG: PfkB family carbohydrate kinase [Lentisphaeria bacterium]|nr:PfkB family carbohydrate kinase [Lentisphaeria bacterium]